METEKKNGDKLIESPYPDDVNAIIEVCAIVNGVTPAEFYHQVVVKMGECVNEGKEITPESVYELVDFEKLQRLILAMLRIPDMRKFLKEALENFKE